MEWKEIQDGIRYKITELNNGKKLLTTIREISNIEADIISKKTLRDEIRRWHYEEFMVGLL